MTEKKMSPEKTKLIAKRNVLKVMTEISDTITDAKASVKTVAGESDISWSELWSWGIDELDIHRLYNDDGSNAEDEVEPDDDNIEEGGDE